MSDATGSKQGRLAQPNGLVTIVIACYQHGKYLAEAIDSALSQTYETVEVVVVNDGSTDSTSSVCHGYASRIRYFEQANAGLANARNAGASHARGEFIAFLDADDVLDPRFVESCMTRLTNSPDCAYAYTQLQMFGRHSETTRFPDFDAHLLRRRNFVSGTTLIRKKVFDRVCFDPRTGGFCDWNLYLSLLERGQVGTLVDEPLVRYRKHSDFSSMNDEVVRRRVVGTSMKLVIVRLHPMLYAPFTRVAYAAAVLVLNGIEGLMGRRRRAEFTGQRPIGPRRM